MIKEDCSCHHCGYVMHEWHFRCLRCSGPVQVLMKAMDRKPSIPELTSERIQELLDEGAEAAREVREQLRATLTPPPGEMQRRLK